MVCVFVSTGVISAMEEEREARLTKTDGTTLILSKNWLVTAEWRAAPPRRKTLYFPVAANTALAWTGLEL